MNETFSELRSNYERETNRSLSMPLAGALVWLVIAARGYVLPENQATVVMLFGTGLIFPISLLIGKLRHENLTDRSNPLSRLMGMSVLMVNLLWAVHLSLLFGARQFFPLSLGIALGIHWIVYSWIIQHPVGLIHALLRSPCSNGLVRFSNSSSDRCTHSDRDRLHGFTCLDEQAINRHTGAGYLKRMRWILIWNRIKYRIHACTDR